MPESSHSSALRLDSPSRVRGALEGLAIRPDKRLGQNFLCDGNWIRKAASCLPPGLPVVEIGPGLGALTAELLSQGREVWAVEADARLCAHLRAAFPSERFHLLHGDAVEEPLARIPEACQPFALLSNLPFAITSPWIDSLLQPGRILPAHLALILQKEGLERILSGPGSKAYGPSAIRLRLAYEARGSETVPASSFHPRPGVESRFGIWEILPHPQLIPAPDAHLLRAFFGQRRKMLRSGMSQWLGEPERRSWQSLLAENGIDETCRPEEISPGLWCQLLPNARQSS